MAWDGLVASSGERLARCWTWCAAIILPSYMLGGERYNFEVFYTLWYSLTQCTGGTVWHTLVVQFDALHWWYSLVRWLPEGGLVPTRIKIGAHTLANIHHGDAHTNNLLDQQQKRQDFIQGLHPLSLNPVFGSFSSMDS